MANVPKSQSPISTKFGSNVILKKSGKKRILDTYIFCYRQLSMLKTNLKVGGADCILLSEDSFFL